MDNLVRDLEARIGRLEAGNRRMRRAGIATVLVASAVGLLGATPAVRVPDVLAAHSFQLVDAGGRVLGTWRAVDADTISFDVSAQSGKSARLELSSGAPYVVVYDRAGERVLADESAESGEANAVKGEEEHSFIRWGAPKKKQEKSDEDAFDWAD